MNNAAHIDFTISAGQQGTVTDRLAKLNKIAARNGLAQATVTFGPIIETETRNEMGFVRILRTVTGVIIAPPMGLDGWSLIATVDHDEAGNIIRTVPGFVGNVPAEFRTSSAARCDHCGLTRNRAKTVLVSHDAEGIKQVGGDCCRVYLGMSAESVLMFADEVSSIDEDMLCGGFGSRGSVSVSEFIATAALVISLYGYKSKAACDYSGTPTSQIVAALVNPSKYDRDNFPEFFAADEAMIERANKLAVAGMAWVAASTDTSDFMQNLKTAAARSEVGRNGGYLTFVAEGYRKSIEADAAKVAADTLPASEYVGTEGAKVTLAGCKVIYTNRSEGYSYHGPDSLYVVLLAADGTKASLNTTVETAIGQTLENAATDARFDIAGAVKAHKLYRDERTTVLTRCKVIG